MQFYEEQARLTTKKYFDKDFKIQFIKDYGKDSYIDFTVKHYPYERFQYSIEVVEHCIKRYKTRSELQRRDFKLYTFALEYRLLDNQFPSSRQKITVEMIEELAATCKNKTELSTKNQSTYKKAIKLGILDKLRFNNAESTIKYLWENIETLTREDIKKELSKHIKNPEPVGEF